MKRFKNILFAVEPSVAQENAIARAVSLAKNSQARLTVVDVISEVVDLSSLALGDTASADLTAMRQLGRKQELEALIAPHREQLDIDVDVLEGRKFIELIHAVLRNDHDLLIKPAENPQRIERLFGSTDMHLLRKCPCPVWLTHPEDKTDYKRIVAAVDYDPDEPDADEKALNTLILELAGSLAVADFASLHIVHAWDTPETGLVRLWADEPDAAEQQYVESARARHTKGMEQIRQQLREQLGEEAYEYLSPKTHLPMGPPSKAIPAIVKELDADLVVMGTVARTGIPGFFIGNTAEAVLDQLQCSVLAIKPPGFKSPV